MKRIIIAIDGPAASGKSTTAKLLAKKLGYVYLDTGAMYRACALQADRQGIKLDDLAAISAMMNRIEISIGFSSEEKADYCESAQVNNDFAPENIIYLFGENICEAIRTPEISALASAISAIPAVRYKMVELQRKLGATGGVVLDGRDIGTYVFPHAECKFFLVASLEERAKRRYLELQAKDRKVDIEQVKADLQARDEADAGRALAPLKAADDAIVIDTSNMSIPQQVEVLHSYVMARLEAL